MYNCIPSIDTQSHVTCCHCGSQHRHRYSRTHFEINKDQGEVQEILQRTMQTRLESFKKAKTGNKIIRDSKKDNMQKVWLKALF